MTKTHAGGRRAGDPPFDTVRVTQRGSALLNTPILNKGTAFDATERREFGLEGLLPHVVSTIDQQVRRAYDNIARKSDAIEKYIGLIALEDRNEPVFYRLLLDHIEEMTPIIYTPTVGLACQQYSRIYRRPRGLWITPEHRGRIEEVLGNAPNRDARLIVVTDNERILGLGDLGAGGIGIPIGKLALYTVAAGIHPGLTLPISLDVGTDNKELLDDELYIGWRHERLRGDEYYALVEEFVTAVQRRFPRALLQWEDFKKANAFVLLDRYRERLLSFNDDIQGTAAMTVAGIVAAMRETGVPVDAQRVLLVGAGAAGVGIARQLRHLFEHAGMTAEAISRAICLLDSGGLVHDGRSLEPTKREFAWSVEHARAAGLPLDSSDLEAFVHALKPTVLVGTSGHPGVFSESAIRAMAEHVERPIVFPLSNPTSMSEAKPADLVPWTAGRALIATGSPFDPVEWEDRTIKIGQANNVYVFPGVGLGALVAEAKVVTDAMFTVAAEQLAAQVSDEDLASGALFPPLNEIRSITAKIAEAVVRKARDDGIGRSLDDGEIAEAVADFMWEPAYPHYDRA